MVVKLYLNNIWRKFVQHPDRCTKEFVTLSLKLFKLIFDHTYDVSNVQIINEEGTT